MGRVFSRRSGDLVTRLQRRQHQLCWCAGAGEGQYVVECHRGDGGSVVMGAVTKAVAGWSVGGLVALKGSNGDKDDLVF
ncbi:hypothetical protein RYX36_011954 [Vicia faba]